MQALNETQIERRVQSAIDRLDRHLIGNQISQEQYDQDIESLDRWAFQELQAWKAENEPAPYRGKETT